MWASGESERPARGTTLQCVETNTGLAAGFIMSDSLMVRALDGFFIRPTNVAFEILKEIGTPVQQAKPDRASTMNKLNDVSTLNRWPNGRWTTLPPAALRVMRASADSLSHTDREKTSTMIQPPELEPSTFGTRRRTDQLFRLLPLLLGFCLAGLPAHAATRIWTGGHASSANWNLRDNWGGVAVPANGDTVVFPSGAARLVNSNNIAGLRLHEIQFLGLGGGFNLRGMSLAVSNGITVAADALNTLSVASVTLHGSLALSVASGGQLTLNSDLVLFNSNLTLAGAGDFSLRGAISGNGDVIKSGSGYVTFFGEKDNTYRGTTIVNAGTLALYQRETISLVPLNVVSRIAVPGNLVVGDGTNAAVVRLNFEDQIANTATVTVVENAEFRILDNYDAIDNLVMRGGNVTMTTGTLVLNGDLTSQASASNASIGGLMLLNSASTFTVADGPANHDLEIAAHIGSTGGHGFTKTGPGTLRLAGTNTYLGPTLINEGLVRVAGDSALGAANNGTTIDAGAELLIETAVDTLREPLTIAGAGLGGASGAIRIGSGAAIATNIVLSAPSTIFTMGGGNLLIDGTISGAGTLTKIGPGTLELAGKSPNTYSGSMLAKEGMLLLSKTLGASVPGNLVIGTPTTAATARNTRSGNVAGGVTVNAASLYDLNDNNESVDSLTLIGGGDVQTGTGELTLDGDVSAQGDGGFGGTVSTIDGRLRLTSTRYFAVAETGGVLGDAPDLIVNAHIRGMGAIIKSGTGDLSLTTSNSFTGALQVDDGEVLLTASHALPDNGGDIILLGDSVLALSGGIEITNRFLTINSTGTASGGPLQSRAGTNVWGGELSLGYESTILQTATNSVLQVHGMIWGSQGGLTKTGPGVLAISGGASNRYAGTTRVLEGTLRLEKHTWPNRAIPGPLIIGDGVGIDLVEARTGLSQISDGAPVTLSESGWLVLQSVSDEKVASLSGNGHVHFVGAGAGLEVEVKGKFTEFTGEISGNGSLIKSGAGTLRLTGTNSYGGDTLVNEGTLVVNGKQPDSDVYVAPGATLRGTGDLGNVAVDGTLAPGDPAGDMLVESLNFLPGGVFKIDLNWVGAFAGHGVVTSRGPVDVGGAAFDVSLGFAPKAGDTFFLCQTRNGNDITGNFLGLPEGSIIVRNDIPLLLTYAGNSGDGNKHLLLTVGDLPLQLESTRVQGGNGNGIIDADECNDIYVAIENSTASPVTVVSAYLHSLDDEIVVTRSASDYGTVPAQTVRTNVTGFQVRTAAGFDCGKNARFQLVVDTTAYGKFTIPVGFPTGQRGSSFVFHGTGLPAMIPDSSGDLHLIEITNRFRVAKVRVSVHATHPAVGQLRFQLIGPADETISFSSTAVELINHRGGAGNNLGSSCDLRTTFDDAAASSVVSSLAPFAGEFRPEDPLSKFIGVSSYGSWRLLVNDSAAGGIGAVQCWSLELFEAECAAGGGGCESCLTSVSGTLDQSSPTLDQRLWRIFPPTGCGDAQPCSGAIVGDNAPYRYQTHSFTNTGPDACVTVALTTPCQASSNVLVGAAYLGDFDPADVCANLIGAGADSGAAGFSGFSFAVPAGEHFTVVINKQNLQAPFSGCGSYSLELYGLPCPQEQPRLHIANDAGPDNVRLRWSTAYPGFDLQGRPSLGGNGVLSVFTNMNATPVVIDGHYTITNKHDAKGNGFFRLRKP